VAAAAERGARTVGCWGGGKTEDAPLLAAGFEPGWDPAWMTAERSDLPPAQGDPRVAITADVPEYDGYGQALLALGASEDAWHAVARVGGVYAGHAWAFASAGVTGVYDVDVRPLFRRQGLGRALTLAVLDAAGAGPITLNATGDGERLYRALGFAHVGAGRTWWLHAGTGGPLGV
jgi:GNAT superfamily N-acetyltransferase